MVKICKGICKRYKPIVLKKPIYDHHRRCTKCGEYMDHIICPCCKNITRSKPRNSANRETYIKDSIRITA